MRIRLTTTIEKELMEELKVIAVRQGVNVNDILEKLIEMYLKGETKIK